MSLQGRGSGGRETAGLCCADDADEHDSARRDAIIRLLLLLLSTDK